MFGKIFEQMFTGSMMGKGSPVFAVWSYVISHQKPDKEAGFQVELNPQLLAACIGESEEVITKTIEFLCSPDPKSRTKAEDGKRLIRLGEFDYKVVNGIKYHAIKKQEQRREQNRAAQAKYRQKHPKKRKVDTGMDGTPASSAYKAEESAELRKYNNGLPSAID